MDVLLEVEGLAAIRNAVQQAVGILSPSTPRIPAPSMDPARQRATNGADARINALMPALEAEINAALQSRSKPALMELITRGPGVLIARDPELSRLDQHLKDRQERRVRDRIFDIMARPLRSSPAAGTRGRNWIGYARSNPERFVDIVLNPRLAGEM